MKRVIGAFLVMFAVFSIVGCSEDDASQSKNASDTVNTIMADFSVAMASIESYRTESLIGYVASEEDCDSLTPEKAESISSEEFVAPDRYRIHLSSKDRLYEFIVIGDQQWTRTARVFDSSIPPWRKVGEPNTNEDGSMSTVTIAMMADEDRFEMLEFIEQLEDDFINGVLCFHLRGTLNETIVNFWISQNNHLLMREQSLTVYSQESDEQPVRSCITKEYSDFNLPISIDAPLGPTEIEN